MPDLGRCFWKALPGGLSPRTWGLRAREHTRRGAGWGAGFGQAPHLQADRAPCAPTLVPWSRFWQAVGRQADLGNAPKRSSAGSAAWTPCCGVAGC